MSIKRNISKLMCVLPDSLYLRIKYYTYFHKRLNLVAPTTFNEKLQWLKLHEKNSLYTDLVDKYAVKQYVEKQLGGVKHIIPTLGVWNSVREIDFSKLPDQFVLKCTHDSHSTVICEDKSTFDCQKAIQTLDHAMRQDYFKFSREYPYRHVKKQIIAEKFMKDGDSEDLVDYKFFCFDGVPRFVGVCTNRSKNLTWDLFDMDFHHIDVTYVAPNSKQPIEKPGTFEQMVEITSVLSAGMPHVRIDLYEINHQVYFGEYTFFSSGGFAPFHPEAYDELFGKYITRI